MDEDGNQLLNLLLPHILKAAEISRVLDVAQQARAGAEAMADASPTATFLIDRQGHLVHSNAAADAIVADGTALTLQNGVLTPTSHSSRAALRKILLALAGPPDLRHSTGGQNHAVLLPRTDHRPPLQLIATHVPKSQSLSTGAEILVLVTDPQKAVQFPDDILRQLYGLTPAEIEVANGILTGYSPTEIADLRRVSKETARNQIKAIMSKTSTTRQSDLVRLLMTLPQPAAK
jgi:DNA-binding CsgD family transcriptional regulator